MSGSGSPEVDSTGSPASRCLVLGGGGLTGIAWLSGVLAALPPLLPGADRVVGTSAGALLAAHRLGGGPEGALTRYVQDLPAIRAGFGVLARLLAAQVWPSRRHALLWLGRWADRPTALAEDDFVALVSDAIGTDRWPRSLIVVAVDVRSGRPAYFTPRSGVGLARAVAASCAVPGVFPVVHIEGRPFLDGGLRSPANIDLASGCERVLALAPQHYSVRVVRRPDQQAARLRAEGSRVVLVRADRIGADAMAADALSSARERGLAQGEPFAPAVRRLWSQPGTVRGA